MTTTLHRQTHVDGLQVSTLFWPVVAGTAGVTAVATAWSPHGWMSIAAVVAVIAVFGIPHGAVDHLVVETVGGHHDRASRSGFVVNYVLAMAAVGLIWLELPPLALVIFIALSVHHFGQSDLAYLRLSGPSALAIQWSRGLFLVGLPLVAHVTSIAPVVERLGGGDPAGWPWLLELWWLWAGVLVVQHAIIGLAVASRMHERTVIGRETVTVGALTLLFLTADPLLGFAVYFGLWHSLAHLLVLTGLLGSEPRPAWSLVRLAAPLTAVSLSVLAAVGVGATLVGRPHVLVPGVFVFVSMLTLPHMIVVEGLWRRRSSTGRVASSSALADPDRTLGRRWVDDSPPLHDLDDAGVDQPARSGTGRLSQVRPVVAIDARLTCDDPGGIRRADRGTTGPLVEQHRDR